MENRSDRDYVIREAGDRGDGDEISYPADDLRAMKDDSGRWRFARKDGTPF